VRYASLASSVLTAPGEAIGEGSMGVWVG